MGKSRYREAILKVLAYIDVNRNSVLDLEILSSVACISKFHLHRIFSEYMGISLGQYIKLKRLESGMWRLVYTDDKTLEIAMDSGYQNHSAFTRAFKQEMGCSPSEFREQFYENKKVALNKSQQVAPTFLGYRTGKVTDILYFRRFGCYFESSAQAWNDLMIDLKRNGINL